MSLLSSAESGRGGGEASNLPLCPCLSLVLTRVSRVSRVSLVPSFRLSPSLSPKHPYRHAHTHTHSYTHTHIHTNTCRYDWAPTVVTQGIWLPIYILLVNKVRVTRGKRVRRNRKGTRRETISVIL